MGSESVRASPGRLQALPRRGGPWASRTRALDPPRGLGVGCGPEGGGVHCVW